MEFTVDQIAAIIGGSVDGNGEEKVNTVSKIQDGQKGSISFLANLKYENFIYETNASAVIASRDFFPKKPLKTTLIRVVDPYSSFTKLLTEYQKMTLSMRTGIEEPSFLDATATVGDNIYRGAFSYIGKGTKIGHNVKIFPHAYIGYNVEIGDNTIIYSGVKVYADCKIGRNCVIQAGTVIGSDGFGFAPQEDGTYKTIPQLGNVVIEDNVDIGANTVIDCATMGSTIIRKGVKLDNLIQVAHNVEIKENTVVAAQTGISGSTVIGKNCVIAGQVGIVGHLTIHDNVKVAAQSGIAKSTKRSGEVLMGSPGFNHGQYLKTYVVFKKLPEMEVRLKQLEEKVLNLPAK